MVMSSWPSVGSAFGADQHAAAVAAGVAEGGQREVGDDLLGRRTTSRNGSSRSLESSATIATL